MKLTCKKCNTAIEISPEATQTPEARVECPGCKARYRLPAPPGSATDCPGSPWRVGDRPSDGRSATAGGDSDRGAGPDRAAIASARPGHGAGTTSDRCAGADSGGRESF